MIARGQTLFVVDITYTAPLEDVDALLEAHIAFLERMYADGRFIASGRKVPRTGGVILAQGDDEGELRAALAGDPFWAQGVADYRITQFVASMTAPQAGGPSSIE